MSVLVLSYYHDAWPFICGEPRVRFTSVTFKPLSMIKEQGLKPLVIYTVTLCFLAVLYFRTTLIFQRSRKNKCLHSNFWKLSRFYSNIENVCCVGSPCTVANTPVSWKFLHVFKDKQTEFSVLDDHSWVERVPLLLGYPPFPFLLKSYWKQW